MQGSLATKLRVLRAERGLTLKQASDLVGVRPGTLLDIEHGRSQPHDRTLGKIARGFGVPIEELLKEPVGAGKVEAPQERGPRVTGVLPTGDGPNVTQEMLKEVGITVTDAELNAINVYLEGLWRRRGEGGGPVATISLKKDNVDHARVSEVARKIDDLLLFWLASGKFTPEEREVVREYAREKALAGTTR
jgi:transcriptional regulator with XRE-family HTH domain